MKILQRVRTANKHFQKLKLQDTTNKEVINFSL